MITKILYKLRIYNDEKKILQVVSYKSKYIKKFASSYFFMTELEELKRCINLAESAKSGVGLQMYWHHLLMMQLEKTVLFESKKICKVHFMTKICNHYPMLTHLARLRVDNSKSVIVKRRNIKGELKQGSDT